LSEDDEAFMRNLLFPEEDRSKYISKPWSGEYRWFRSPNVVCIEHYRPNGPARAISRRD
jgi:hypothetical protein